LSAGQAGFYGVGSVTSSRCSTQDKAEPTPPFPTPNRKSPYFHLFLQGAHLMGTPYSSIQPENSVLDQIYSSDPYPLLSADDLKYHKLNSSNDLGLVSDGISLEYWLDLNA
jgi:hypothetical protein